MWVNVPVFFLLSNARDLGDTPLNAPGDVAVSGRPPSCVAVDKFEVWTYGYCVTLQTIATD